MHVHKCQLVLFFAFFKKNRFEFFPFLGFILVLPKLLLAERDDGPGRVHKGLEVEL